VHNGLALVARLSQQGTDELALRATQANNDCVRLVCQHLVNLFEIDLQCRHVFVLCRALFTEQDFVFWMFIFRILFVVQFALFT
jgi:hypothetical protein